MRLYASDGAIDGATACGEMIHRKLLELADLLAIVLSILDLHFFQSQTFWFNTVGRFFPAITIRYKILQVCIKTRHELGEGRNDL